MRPSDTTVIAVMLPWGQAILDGPVCWKPDLSVAGVVVIIRCQHAHEFSAKQASTARPTLEYATLRVSMMVRMSFDHIVNLSPALLLPYDIVD